MRMRFAWSVSAVLLVATWCGALAQEVRRVPAPQRAEPRGLPRGDGGPVGAYRVEGSGGVMVTIVAVAPNVYALESPGRWEAVGRMDGGALRALFVVPGEPLAAGALRAIPGPGGTLAVQLEYLEGRAGAIPESWTRVGDLAPRVHEPLPGARPDPGNPDIVVVQPEKDRLPGFGEYVYVEELPEAITKVPPVYPDAARRAGIEGTVMVQALVLQDGSVGEVRIVKSVSGLDEAAVASVRRWGFKPALTKGQPVAVWVAVPVRFSLH